MTIAYCYHNLVLLGVNAHEALEEIAEMSGPRINGLVRGLLRRSPAEKSLQSFGLQMERTPDGFVIDFTG